MLDIIKKYDTIIVHRHTRPDYDAFGSQIGLARLIKNNFKDKNVFIVGEDVKNFLSPMDVIEDEVFNNALSIITDVCVSHMVDDTRYTLAKEVLVIDHHANDSDIEATLIQDTKASSACELIVRLALENNLEIDKDTATALYTGMLTDTGRFKYDSTTGNTFRMAAELFDKGANSKMIFDGLYNNETIAEKKLKAYFSLNFELTNENVAYHFNTKEKMENEFKEYNFFKVSRGMVNQMAGVADILIWANFTFDKESEKIVCEFRSSKYSIVDIAKKYGGGGHAKACGATVDNFDVAKEVLKDFDELIKKNK